MAPIRRASSLLFLALAAGCGGEEPGEGARQTATTAGPPPRARADINVLVLSVDTLRADRLGCYGNQDWGRSPSPAVDALAKRGVVFDQSNVPRGQTRPSIAALFSGKFPITTGLRENGLMLLEEHRTFLQRLSEGGHRTGAFIANFSTSGLGSQWAYRGADVAVQGMGQMGQHVPESRVQVQWDDRVEEAALAFLDGHDTDSPFTAYVHFYDVHKPYNPPEGFDLYGHYDGMPPALTDTGLDSGGAIHAHLDAITLGNRAVPPEELRRILGLYDGTVTATDARIGRILERLEAIGVADRTYVIFTADHGEELFDRNRYFYHGNSIYDGVVRVPLVIAGPDIVGGRRVADLVQNIDVTATIYELAGLPVPSDCEGLGFADALLGGGSFGGRKHAYIEWQDVAYAVTDGRYSYVHNPQGAHLRKPPYYKTEAAYEIGCYEGYDVEADPLQSQDLLAGRRASELEDPDKLPAPLVELRRALDTWLDDPRHEKTMSRPGMNAGYAAQMEQELMMLQKLGYVGPTRHDRVYLGCDSQ